VLQNELILNWNMKALQVICCYLTSLFVLVTCISIRMLAKCGSIEYVWKTFNKTMPFSNVITWTAMIFGHVQCKQG
jgi:hypothetical protein